MKLLLCLCIVSSVIAIKFDGPKCLTAFSTIGQVVGLKQRDLEEICSDPAKVQEKTQILKDILRECGLLDWQNPSNDAIDRRIGSVIEGLFGYVKKLFCLKRKNTYCFPGAVKIFDPSYLIDILTESGGSFDSDKMNLKCSVMSKKETIKAICPGGKLNSGKRLCQEAMVNHFELAVRTIQAMLSNYEPNEITEQIMPLLNLAIDVKEICKVGRRKKARRLVKKECSGPKPTDEPDFPNCLHEQPIKTQCLRDEICTIYSDKPVCNKIEKDTLSVLATQANYKGLLAPKFTLPDDTDLTLERAQEICCDAACQEARDSGKKCEKIHTHHNEIEIKFPGRDLVEDIKGLNDEQKEKLKSACCRDQQAKIGSFLMEDCHVDFKDGRKETDRRLLAETTSIIVTITVNSSDDTPFSCENDGSFYAFDSVLSTETTNTNMTDDVSTQATCNCTNDQGEVSCADIDESEATSSQNEIGSSGEYTSVEEEESEASSAMQFSISLVAMLFCVLFAINGSNM